MDSYPQVFLHVPSCFHHRYRREMRIVQIRVVQMFPRRGFSFILDTSKSKVSNLQERGKGSIHAYDVGLPLNAEPFKGLQSYCFLP